MKWSRRDWALYFAGIAMIEYARAASNPRTVFREPASIGLALAIDRDNARKVRELAAAGADLSAHGQDDVTFLQWAMLRNRPAMVELLLDLGANPVQAGYQQMTALHTAAMARDKPYLAMMLKHAADPNARGGRMKAPVLSEAILNGNGEAVALLLARHANPNASDRQGDTALHVAAQINDYTTMLILLQAGADPAIRNVAGKTFAPYFAIHPKESLMSSDALSARRAVQRWLDGHGYGGRSKEMIARRHGYFSTTANINCSRNKLEDRHFQHQQHQQAPE